MLTKKNMKIAYINTVTLIMNPIWTFCQFNNQQFMMLEMEYTDTLQKSAQTI